MQNIRYFLQVVGLLALLIGGIGIVNTMQVLLRGARPRSPCSRRPATGALTSTLLFGLEAAILGVLGGVVGAAAGIGVSFLVQGLVREAFFITSARTRSTRSPSLPAC